VRLCGVPLVVRLLYVLKTSGIREAILVAGPHLEAMRSFLGNGRRLGLELSYAKDLPEALEMAGGGEVLLLPVGAVVSESFLKALLAEGRATVALADGEVLGVVKAPVEVLKALLGPGGPEEPAELAGELLSRGLAGPLDVSSLEVFEPGLKRTLRPMCVVVRDRASWLEAKRALVFRTQKGLHLTSYLNKPVEDRIVYHLSEHPKVTPNAITVLGNLLAFSVAPLFIIGPQLLGDHGFLLAALLAYLVGIIDGLDGKLARSRGFLTKLGHIEHSFDMLFEQTWYLAFTAGLYLALGFLWWVPLLGGAFLVLDSFVRHVYMQFKDTMGLALTAYSPADRAFARIDGRRNIYVLYIIVASALGVPLYALLAMTVHAALTALVYVVRAIKHMRDADRASGIDRWIDLIKEAPRLEKA